MPPRRRNAAKTRSSETTEQQSQAGLGSLAEPVNPEPASPEGNEQASPEPDGPEANQREAGSPGSQHDASGDAAPGSGDALGADAQAPAAAGDKPPENKEAGRKPHREEDADMADTENQEDQTQDNQPQDGEEEPNTGAGASAAVAVLKDAPAPNLLEIAEKMPAPPEEPSGFVMIDDPDLKDMMIAIHENTGGKGITQKLLERVSVPSGGGVQWRRETAGGEVVRRDSVDGVILHANVNRAYWSTSLEEDGRQPPDCYSNDGVKGSKYGECAACQFAEFGSGGGNRQACKKSMNLFMLEEDKMIPTVVQVPTMSIGEINANETEGSRYRRSYFTTDLLAPGVMKPFHRVVTSLVLDEAENNDGILYSVIKPKLNAVIGRDAYPRIDAIRAATLNLVQTNTEVEAIRNQGEGEEGGGEGQGKADSNIVDGSVVNPGDGANDLEQELFGDASDE